MDAAKQGDLEPTEHFVPAPYYEVSQPAQLKVFTDPLRIRVLNVLEQREATNQQVADSLGEPTAKVLYHVRFLIDAGLIRLVRTEVKGGNVEKYYRSIALAFTLSPAREGMPEFELGATNAVLEAVRHEAVASLARWPEQESLVERRPGRLDSKRVEEFRRRLGELLDEFWTEEEELEAEENDADSTTPRRWRLLVAMYRDPTSGE